MSKALLATERDIAQGNFSSLLLGLSLALADGNRSFLSYQIVAITVLCIQMCPHTLFAHSLRERLHHCQIFYGVLCGKETISFAHAHAVVPRPFPRKAWERGSMWCTYTATRVTRKRSQPYRDRISLAESAIISLHSAT